jgi:endonuclease/exonuclease/phosphatase family metal-dependent hydrolase
MRKRLTLNILFTIFTLLCYACVLFPPTWWWLLGFMAMLIPVCLILQFLFLIYWLAYRKFLFACLPFCVLLFGFPFLKASIALTFLDKDSTKHKNFSVLTYNVQVFNAYTKKNKDYKISKHLINWVKNDESDIKCLQEFYTIPKHEVFNTVSAITKDKKYHSYFQSALTDKRGGKFGLAIFTRFPIVNKGEIDLKDKSYNDAIFADILIEKDTLRIYNIHLQSMKINQKRMTDTDKWKENLIDLSQRLQKGFAARSKQIDIIGEHLTNSPYPVILCGDLNDLPYSYTYFRLKKQLKNAFEEAGNGFEISLNSQIFYVRIDNQFFSPQIDIFDYQTIKEVNYSDHFPIKVAYGIQKK